MLCDLLTGAAGTCIGHRPFQSHLKPYWDSGLREYHKQMRYYRSQWCRAGRPRNKTYTEYMSYKTAKRNFRRAHRTAANGHMMQLNREIDESAEMNTNDFWKHVNTRRIAYNYNKFTSGIKFGEIAHRDQKAITEQWGFYFERLYSPSNSEHFDDKWRDHVSQNVGQLC
ncbi:hypothetical protein DPMN_128519 [Dreissena polymorpha]|uniref:Uncharacterized protein n=1 Tax=Dreissena polymorpha TaxID=45954 RepID=A0A9D4JVT9_DREPO|nr:hypothetical protein DPMN_128519 [Dreissena polymorpha]